ncbi:MAG: hypothetical protein JWQ04_1113 [Pedosphaera sp.]|nr:hypothetical protein [Pedosphaera sp.]
MLFCLFGSAAAAKAQQVLMVPPPSYSVTPPAMQEEQQNEGLGWLQPGVGKIPLPGFSDLWHWGPVTLRPHATYQLLYADGIQSAPGQQQASVVQTFTAGMLFTIGTHWTLDYDASLTYYSNHQLTDSLGHSATLTWGTSYDDWTLGFSQGFTTSDAPNVETGAQTSIQGYSTSLSASHRFTSAFSMDFGVSQSISLVTGFTSSDTWSTSDWLNYQFWPRLDGALGVTYGYSAVSAGNDLSNESLQARLSWRIANKSSLVVHGGVADVQYLGSGLPDLITPTFGASFQYQAFRNTAISLSADRGITPSLLQNQASISTSLSVTLTQQILKRFSLSVAGSYGDNEYVASAAGINVNRSDTSYSISTSLSWALLKRASIALTHQYSVNSSSAAGFSFASTQYGLQLGYSF